MQSAQSHRFAERECECRSALPKGSGGQVSERGRLRLVVGTGGKTYLCGPAGFEARVEQGFGPFGWWTCPVPARQGQDMVLGKAEQKAEADSLDFDTGVE